jgi:signal transduction histidine kinase/DNA-binding response OmpR family regulator
MSIRAFNRPQRETKILYIEDNPENRMLVRALLEAEAYTVVEAEDGLTGIEAALREEPALILLDINLPGVDGYEVGVVLRSFPDLATTPIIAVTAYAMSGDRQRTLVAGCDGYIQKPIDPDAFPRQVAEFLEGKRERVEEREAGTYLRELNQRLVHRLVNQIGELKRLNLNSNRRARQLEDLHAAVQDITSELGIAPLLERLLPAVARALGTADLTVALTDPAGVHVSVAGDPVPASPAGGTAEPGGPEWTEVEWRIPLAIRGRTLGVMAARQRVAAGAQSEEEHLLKIVANQVAIAVENARLYEETRHRLRETETLARRQAAFVEIVEELAGQGDFERFFSLIGQRACELVGGDCAVVSLVEGDEIAYRGSWGLDDPTRLTWRRPIDESRLGRVLREKRPFPSNDLATDPHWKDSAIATRLGFRAGVHVPICLRGKAIGVLGILYRAPRSFDEEECRLLVSLAEHIAVAVDRTNLLTNLNARLNETATLLTISRAISSTLDLTETLRGVARAMARTLGADMVGAYMVDDAGTSLRPVAGYHVPKDLVDQFLRHPIPLGIPALARAWRDRRPVWAMDAASDPDVAGETFQKFPHRSHLFVPMTVKGEPVGGFFVIWWDRARQFTAEELRLVEGIRDQASVFVENARLYSEATRRQREAEDLARMARMLTESLEAADVGPRIVDSALTLMGARFSVLRLLLPDGSLRLATWRGEAQEIGEAAPVTTAGTGMAGPVVTEGRAVWSPDVLADPRFTLAEEARERLAAAGSCAFLAVPLWVKREIVGVLKVGAAAGRVFSAAEIALFETFADQAAVALENSRLYGELRVALETVEESQQRIVQGERLRALGEMAGGVAHDFNNALAIIVGRSEAILCDTEDAEVKRQLEVVIKVALDAAQTVKRIQEFTRMRKARPFQSVDLNQVVEEVVEVTRSRWKNEAQARGLVYDVEVEARPVPLIAADPSELREALTNIFFNAFDAMPEGGRLTLRTGVRGHRAVCTIADTGVGMPPEVRQRIFDPFFTTKGERGTGLGLSVVYGIVARHGGELDVESEPGQGTTFIIRLPLGGDATGERPARPPAQPGTRVRVLVVDDDVEVAQIAVNLLKRDGHQVVVCNDGEAAVAEFGRAPFDLVFTDLGMPGISGWDVARRIKSLRPATPIAMVTGWGDRIDLGEAKLRGADYIVSKPFRQNEIREVVSHAVAGGPAPAGLTGVAAAATDARR